MKRIPTSRHRRPVGSARADHVDAMDGAEPTLENFVAFNKNHPGGNLSSSFFPGIDGLFAIDEELQRFEIPTDLLAGVLDGDEQEMSRLAFMLCERLADRRQLERDGASHVQRRRQGISDGLLDYLAIAMLETCATDQLPPPFPLFVLLRERLVGTNPHLRRQSFQKLRVRDAICAGALMLKRGETPSIRAIAKVLGLEASTVSRWFPAGDFEKKCADFLELLSRFNVKL